MGFATTTKVTQSLAAMPAAALLAASLWGPAATAGPPPGPDVEVAHVEVTQGLQDGLNSIPLVAGKPTVIRVFPKTADGESVDVVSAVLTAMRDGTELPGSPIEPDNGPIAATADPVDRADADASLNFTLDPDWYSEDTTISVELTLPEGVDDPDPTNNMWSNELEFAEREPLSIRYVVVRYQNENWNGPEGARDRVRAQEAADFLRSIYPIDPVELTYDPWAPVEITFSEGSSQGDLDGDRLISELNTLFAASPDPPDRLYAWTPENSYPSNGLSDPLWAGGQNRVALGNDTGDEGTPPVNSRWRRTFAHEIGHNTHATGLVHTSRRLEDDEYGYDVLGTDPFGRVVMRKYPASDPTPDRDLFDFMRGGEIEPRAWITPPYYMELFDFLDPQRADEQEFVVAQRVADRSARSQLADVAPPEDLLVVRGSVTRDGEGSFFPFYRIPATEENLALAVQTPCEGTHQIRFYRGDEEVRDARIAWTPDFRVSPEDTERDYLESRPFTWFVEPLEDVTRVELRLGDGVLDTLQVSSSPPVLSTLNVRSQPPLTARSALDAGTDRAAALRERTVQLSWESRARSATDSSRETTHQVFYSCADGNRRLVATGLTKPEVDINIGSLPGGQDCRFEVRSTDGYNVSSMTSDAIDVPPSPPTLTILAPRSGRTVEEGASVLLVGRGFDVADGKVDPSALRWTSDLQGDLGTGEKLVVRDLQPGEHTISLSLEGEPEVEQSITVVVE